ncbi:hypothetical protein M446_4156 [Methylobacterium sp. 4-46]|nr:hypothetical protein M446_4156 [Methylobacterium sp. 4-46]
MNEWDRMFTREAYDALPASLHAKRPFEPGPYRCWDGKSLTWYWVGEDGLSQTKTLPAIFVGRPAYRPRLEFGDVL